MKFGLGLQVFKHQGLEIWKTLLGEEGRTYSSNPFMIQERQKVRWLFAQSEKEELTQSGSNLQDQVLVFCCLTFIFMT